MSPRGRRRTPATQNEETGGACGVRVRLWIRHQKGSLLTAARPLFANRSRALPDFPSCGSPSSRSSSYIVAEDTRSRAVNQVFNIRALRRPRDQPGPSHDIQARPMAREWHHSAVLPGDLESRIASLPIVSREVCWSEVDKNRRVLPADAGCGRGRKNPCRGFSNGRIWETYYPKRCFLGGVDAGLGDDRKRFNTHEGD